MSLTAESKPKSAIFVLLQIMLASLATSRVLEHVYGFNQTAMCIVTAWLMEPESPFRLRTGSFSDWLVYNPWPRVLVSVVYKYF